MKLNDEVLTPDGPGYVTGIRKGKTRDQRGVFRPDPQIAVYLHEQRRVRYYHPAEVMPR